MQAMCHWRGIAVLLLLAPAVCPAWSRGQNSADRPAVRSTEALIEDLGSADPRVRERATKALTAQGRPARPQLMEARRSESPEVRLRATALLLALPWDPPGDPPAVRSVLNGYGTKAAHQRRAV